ncbi:MAG: TIGR00159 family protein [Muribaculaceae bacterium]|nr:TIGR00159 family protein [Muribaculaceae bacterium]
MLDNFGIRDALDILIMALLLYYLFKLMKDSGTLNIFFGVLAFIVAWVFTSQILEMKLLGTVLDKFMSIGALVFVVIFQDQIKRFLVELGDHKRWHFLGRLMRSKNANSKVEENSAITDIEFACRNMSKSKTGALIVLQESIPLEGYEKTGDMIDAKINMRLIENIFFKNSPLHDGALIIANGRIKAAGCILPISHDDSIPRALGLRHRAALGIAQATDALAIIVSEETGNISVAWRGQLETRIDSTKLVDYLTKVLK